MAETEPLPARARGAGRSFLPAQLLNRWPYFLLVALVLLVYANGLGNSFSSYDDYPEIVNNQYLSNFRGIAGYFLQTARFTPQGSQESYETYYRPLTWLRLALERAVWGPHPFGYRLTNVLLHALNACLVYRLFLAAFEEVGPAIAIALVWALHPVHTEAVTWISAGSCPFFTLLALLALLRFLRATEDPLDWRLGPPLLFLLALLAYELVAPLPALALLLDTAIARQRGEPAGQRLRRHWRLHLGLWTVLGGYLLLRGVFLGFGTALTSPGLTRDLGPRLLRLPQVLATYLWVSLVPLRLSLDRGSMLVPVHTVWEPAVLLPTLLLLLFEALTWWLARRLPLAFFGGLWFGLAIMPVSNLLPQPYQSLVAERYLYFTGIGLAALGVAGIVLWTERLARLHPGFPWQRCALGLLILLLAGYGARVLARNRDWADSVRLWSRTIAVNPTSSVAHLNLGEALATRGQLASAEEQFGLALRFDPAFRAARLNLAIVYEKQGKVEQAEAAYRRLIQDERAYIKGYLQLARLYLKLGRTEEAIALFQRALLIDPNNLIARNNLAMAYLRQGRLQEGIAELKKAVALDPGNAALQHNLGLAYQRAGRPDLAADAFRRSAEGTPETADPRWTGD